MSCYTLPSRLEEKYRLFNRRAHREGIKVHALSGDPRWALTRFHHLQISWVKTILAFNARGEPDERFDGVHSDIEPYALPDWQTRPKELLTQYLELVDQTARMVRESDSGIMFCLDIPFWWDEDPKMTVEFKGSVKTTAEHIMERVPSIAVMDYRNFADGQNGSIALISDEFDIADRTGTQIYIGQETQAGIEPPYVTFGNGDRWTMEREIKKLIAAYADRPSFAGIAMHHYVSYRKMIEGN